MRTTFLIYVKMKKKIEFFKKNQYFSKTNQNFYLISIFFHFEFHNFQNFQKKV